MNSKACAAVNACRLMELSSRRHHDTEFESERLRAAQFHTEKLRDATERANRERVRGLEEQVLMKLMIIYLLRPSYFTIRVLVADDVCW